MAEIKSTLELAMERTKKMTISEKEKKEIKQKEIEQKVNSFSHRYMEGYLSLNEILREMERMDEKTMTKVKEILLCQWIDALSLNDGGEGLLKGIESLKQHSVIELKQKYDDLLSQYRSEKEKIKEKVRSQLTEALTKEGIRGSSVEPNVEASRSWEKESGDLDHLYSVKLKDIKNQLRAYK